jgi:hypothetical protein
VVRTVITLTASFRLHGGERVARVDRAYERVRGFDCDDVGNLLRIQQRGRPRHHVLAVRRRRCEHVRVVFRDRYDQRRDVLRDLVVELRCVRVQHLGDARDLRRRFRRLAAAVPCDEHVDVAADLLRGGHGIERGFLDRLVVVLGEDQDGHRRLLR